jgi:hypothetical protein
MIGKIQSNRKMIVTILAISIIFGSSISQFDGFAAAKDDESVIENVNFESCCCCATNILKVQSDVKGVSDLLIQIKAKAKEDREKYGPIIICIYEKSTGYIICSDGETIKNCEAISGDGEELDSTKDEGPIPTGKWLIGERRNNGTGFNLLRVTGEENGVIKFKPYDTLIPQYNRNQFSLHLGNDYENGIAIDKYHWENLELSDFISKGNLLINNTDFYGFLYVQYFYKNEEFSNSIVDLVITRDDQSDIKIPPPSLFEGEYTPEVLKKIEDYPKLYGKTGTGNHEKYPYRWRYRATKKGEVKIKDFILDNVPDNPLNTANWGNWVASFGWKLTNIEPNDNGKWKITWETDTPVDAVMVGFDHKFAFDPEHPKGDCEVSFHIDNDRGKIYVPQDAPPTIEKQPLTGVFSTYNLLPDNVIELNVRVVGDFYSNKIYDIEIFPESQNPPWYGIDAIEAPEGWDYEKIGKGIRFYTLTDPLIKCQPKKFIFRVWGIRISRYIEIHITDKDHLNLGVILSTWWQLKKVYRH